MASPVIEHAPLAEVSSSPQPDSAPLPSSAAEEPESQPDVETLITSLKASLATSQTLITSQTTRLTALNTMEEQHLVLKDRYAFLSAAKEAVELQLKEETKRREVAEENVELLRSQVESARRGVMQLQKQEKDRRRVSAMPHGAGSVAVAITEDNENLDSRASKRQSMLRTPAENVASTSGGLRELRLGHNTSPAALSTSPGTGGSSFFEDLAASKTRRQSGSSIAHSNSNDIDVVAAGAAAAEEAAALRNELLQVHARLAESEEARQASDTCLKALREFIATGNGGTASPQQEDGDLLRGIRLPPLPTDKEPEEEENKPEKKSSGSGWGLRLWKGQAGQASPALSTAVEPPATPHTPISPPITRSSSTKSPLPDSIELPSETNLPSLSSTTTPLASFVSSWTKSVAPGTPANNPSSSGPTNSRKISSFFSRAAPSNTKVEKDLPSPPPDVLEPSPEIEISEMDKAEAEIEERNRLAAAREFEHPHEDEEAHAQPTPGTMNSGLEEEVATPILSPAVEAEEASDGLESIKGEVETKSESLDGEVEKIHDLNL